MAKLLVILFAALCLTAGARAADAARVLKVGIGLTTAAVLEQLKARGMQVARIDVRESEKVRNRLRPVLEQYNNRIGESTVLAMYVELSQLRMARGSRAAGTAAAP